MHVIKFEVSEAGAHTLSSFFSSSYLLARRVYLIFDVTAFLKGFFSMLRTGLGT